MSQSRGSCLHTFLRFFLLAATTAMVVASTGCGGAITSSDPSSGDPLHLGVHPGPMGSTDPQVIQVRAGSEPSDRIVSLSLALDSLKVTNSGNSDIDLLTAPVALEFTHSAIVTEPVVIRTIYQDTYSTLKFPDMTGQVVFYDSNGQLASQALSISAQSISLSPNLVLGVDPEVVSVSLDLSQSFTVGASSVTVNPLVVATSTAVPAPAVPPALSQPETGGFIFLVGAVTGVDTTNQLISLQPSSGDPLQIAYSVLGATNCVNCDPAMLTGMTIQMEGETQRDSSVLATQISVVGVNATDSELYGILDGYAPDGISYNLIVEGGTGANVTTGLIGNKVTLDWLAASYCVNTTHLGLDLIAFDDLVFDETHVFPGQFVQVSQDTLIVPDPDSANAGFMQPHIFELEEQTITGQVFNYVYDSESQIGTFTLAVASDSAIKTMNSGLVSITVRQLPQTDLRNSPTFADGEQVKVRGFLFAEAQYSNVNYQPPASPVAFIMAADRIVK